MLPARCWAAFLLLALCVHFAAGLVQVHCNRELGVGVYAALQPLRLVSSVLGSYALLGEEVEGWMAWLGLLVVGGTVSVYTLLKNRQKK